MFAGGAPFSMSPGTLGPGESYEAAKFTLSVPRSDAFSKGSP